MLTGKRQIWQRDKRWERETYSNRDTQKQRVWADGLRNREILFLNIMGKANSNKPKRKRSRSYVLFHMRCSREFLWGDIWTGIWMDCIKGKLNNPLASKACMCVLCLNRYYHFPLGMVWTNPLEIPLEPKNRVLLSFQLWDVYVRGHALCHIWHLTYLHMFVREPSWCPLYTHSAHTHKQNTIFVF